MGSAQQKCDSSVSNTTKTLKEDIMVVLLLPILCGVYSFLHWFILVPLLWTVFAHGNWNATSFLVYEVVAFVIWVAVIIILLNMKCCKKTKSPRSELKTCNDSSSHLAPHFQTRTAHVQPKDENLFHESHLPQSGCKNGDKQVSILMYSIPVQPQCAPSASSKKNMEKSDDVFPESVPEVLDQNPQTLVLPINENIKSNPRHSSSLVTECAGENMDSKDNVYHSNGNECGDDPSLKDSVMPDKNLSQNQEKHPHLSREESFVGLPEMNSFGSYLQLVTVDTPFSPSEQFFPDSMKKADSDRTAQVNQSKDVNSLDSPALQEGGIRSKVKDITDDHQGGDNTSGRGGSSSGISKDSGKSEKEVEAGKRNSEKPTKGSGGDDGDDDVFTLGAPVPHSKPKESLGECFIADVRKTESLTSEVFITVNEPSRHKNAGDIIHVNLPSDALQHNVMNETNVHEEGRWAILK